jgi:single-stranded DNA-binding protein
MTLHALISGSLFRAPESRTSKNGRQFVSATIRVKDGGESRFVNLAAFSDTAQAELVRLKDGDAVSVQGPLKAGTYTASDGTTKLSISINADQILALKQQPKKREVKPAQQPDARSRQERCAGSWQSPVDGPNDDIGF